MNKILVVLLVTVLAGCVDDVVVDADIEVWTVCINGVTYYEGYRSLAPAYNPNGGLILCEVKNK